MKKYKKLLYIIIPILMVIILANIDYKIIKKNRSPLFAIYIKGFNRWIGFGYTVFRCESDPNLRAFVDESYKLQLMPDFNYACVYSYDVEVLDERELNNENKLIATDRCSATYSTNPNVADKCILATLEITFTNNKVSYIKIIKVYNSKRDAKNEYEYDIANWSDTYTDPKPQLDDNKLIQQGSINEFPGLESDFSGLSRIEIEELLKENGFEINFY